MNNGALRCEVQFLEVLGRSLAILATGAVFACAASGDTVAIYKLTNAHMETPFNLNLKVQRRKSGLSQEDVAHLIGVHPSKISLLEGGRALPSLKDIAALSVVFGKSFEEFVFSFIQEARKKIGSRLPSMPKPPKRWLSHFNRQHTIDAMADQLTDQEKHHEAS